MDKEKVANPVVEFRVTLAVMFDGGKQKTYVSPVYKSVKSGLGPALLVHVLNSRIKDWVNKIFSEDDA